MTLIELENIIKQQLFDFIAVNLFKIKNSTVIMSYQSVKCATLQSGLGKTT